MYAVSLCLVRREPAPIRKVTRVLHSARRRFLLQVGVRDLVGRGCQMTWIADLLEHIRFELDFTLEERWGCSSPPLPRSLLEKSSMIKIQIGLASYCWTWVHRRQVKFPSVDGKTNTSLPGSVKASFTLRERAAPSSWSGRDQRLSSRLCASDTREFHP